MPKKSVNPQTQPPELLEPTAPVVSTPIEEVLTAQPEPETYPVPVAVVPTGKTIPVDSLVDVGEPVLHNNLVHPAVSQHDADTLARRDAFVQLVRDRQNPPVKEYVAPAPTERQKTQREVEMEAGRKRVTAAADLIARTPKRVEKIDPNAAKTVPVYRPADGAGSKERTPTRLKMG